MVDYFLIKNNSNDFDGFQNKFSNGCSCNPFQIFKYKYKNKNKNKNKKRKWYLGEIEKWTDVAFLFWSKRMMWLLHVGIAFRGWGKRGKFLIFGVWGNKISRDFSFWGEWRQHFFLKSVFPPSFPFTYLFMLKCLLSHFAFTRNRRQWVKPYIKQTELRAKIGRPINHFLSKLWDLSLFWILILLLQVLFFFSNWIL